MANNGMDTKHTRHIYRRMNLVINGEESNFNKAVWYQGVLKLAELTTKNSTEYELNPRLGYYMVRLDN